MAEGENKKVTIEMSIWFVIMLVILIVCSSIILKMRGDIRTITADRDKFESEFQIANESRNTLRSNIAALTSKIGENKGSYSIDEVIAELNGLLSEEGISVNSDLSITHIDETMISGESGEAE